MILPQDVEETFLQWVERFIHPRPNYTREEVLNIARGAFQEGRLTEARDNIESVRLALQSAYYN